MKYLLLIFWLLIWWLKLLVFDIICFVWAFKLYHFRRCNNYLDTTYSPNRHDDQDVIFTQDGEYSNAYSATFFYVFE